MFTGERGTTHAHFAAVSSPIWAFLDSVLAESASGTKARKERGTILQASCACLADPIEGQSLRHYIVCPQCTSSRLAWWGGERVGFAEVPHASFSHFMSSPESERRSEEHTSELQSLMRISYAVFCLKKKTNTITKCT